MCGGSIGNELHDCSSVDVYDAARDVWKTVACVAGRVEDAPRRRAMHAAAKFGNKWIIVGGGDNEKPVCDAYWLDVRKCVDEDECAWEDVRRRQARRSRRDVRDDRRVRRDKE